MNEIVLSVVIKRESLSRIAVSFAREGHGDDIVEQWAERIELAGKYAAGVMPSNAERPASNEEVREIPALHRAVYAGDLEWLGKLIEADPNSVNVRGTAGNTALHIAARDEVADSADEDGVMFPTTSPHEGHEVTGFLLANGADANVLNEDGLAPLHIAAMCGMIGLADLLMRCGAKKDFPAANGWTAFAYAKAYHHEEMAWFVAKWTVGSVRK